MYMLVTVFVIGVSSGVIENFAYVRLREVGGEGTVMGVSRFFSSITGVPMFWYSGKEGYWYLSRRDEKKGFALIYISPQPFFHQATSPRD